MQPAGFWRRYAAWSLDSAAIGVVAAILTWSAVHTRMTALMIAWQAFAALVRARVGAGVDLSAPVAQAMQWAADPAMLAAGDAVQSSINALLWPPLIAFALLGLAYHAFFEASSRQSTPGQRVLGMQVCCSDGNALDIPRAMFRHAAGALSWITLNIGHAMALIPPRRLALHDIVSKTRVLREDGDDTLPAWAKAWIAVQGLALMWITIASGVAAGRALQAALDAAM